MDELQRKLIKQIAIDTNNDVWGYLQKDSLENEEFSSMLQGAYTSLHLWSLVGTKINIARGHWLLSRACCVANMKDLALLHAVLCDNFTKESGEDKKIYDQFYSHEALARANAANGMLELAREEHQNAMIVLDQINDEETKQICTSDLQSKPWFGLI